MHPRLPIGRRGRTHLQSKVKAICNDASQSHSFGALLHSESEKSRGDERSGLPYFFNMELDSSSKRTG